ncbi:MAG: AmmeMemoRadiSam system radical SAM enzyme [Thermodesulfobacteriota bacterium]
MREAELWKGIGNKKVECRLCCHRCKINDGKRGICGVRENRGGKLWSLNYGLLIARNIDPIEKKPFFHFQPGSTSYSIATAGCNFRCLHCQNYEISQMPREGGKVVTGMAATPEEVVSDAESGGSAGISYTYTEPTIFFEFARDCARLAKERGLKNNFVTNGFMTSECLGEMRGLLDAANVDVKSFSDDFYKKVCGARLAPVLETVERMKAVGIWVEVTTLIIPTLNDTDDELRKVAKWLYQTDPSIPWHISAFYPTYKLTDLPRTPVSTINRAREIGLAEGLKYVYSGNVPGDPGESTYCYFCKELLIERVGFTVRKNLIKDSKCPHCSVEIDGVEM